MKNVMMTLLCFMLIICMDSVFGMDNKSAKSDSSNEEENIDLAQYTKQELNFENYKSEAEYCIKNVSNTSENNSNGLKRKKKPDKTLVCEICQKESNRYIKGKFSSQCLCNACYAYESRHGVIGPQNERYYTGKHKDQILACEFCQNESKHYVTGKCSGKSLCKTCYSYESRHGKLVPQEERRKKGKHKDQILACEFCQKKSKIYVKGKCSGKLLCNACYLYESRHGQLVHLNERRYIGKHNQTLLCELCQKESNRYIKGKFSGQCLCHSCYAYESRHGVIGPQNVRYFTGKHKDQILVCENCQKESKQYVTGKFSGKSLCRPCYKYESRHGVLRPQSEQDYNEKHKDQRNTSLNRLFEAENSQNKEKNDSTKYSAEQQKKHE